MKDLVAAAVALLASDAGATPIVDRTDATGLGGIAIPPPANVVAEHSIAEPAHDRMLADAWVEAVAAREGRAALAAARFLAGGESASRRDSK